MVTQVTSFGRSGVSDWLMQLTTAIILVAYLIFIAGYLILNADVTYDQWKALFDSTPVKAFTSLTILAIVVHAWIGLWAVSTDYMTSRMMGAKATFIRLGFQAAYSLVLFYYLIWGFQILWS